MMLQLQIIGCCSPNENMMNILEFCLSVWVLHVEAANSSDLRTWLLVLGLLTATSTPISTTFVFPQVATVARANYSNHQHAQWFFFQKCGASAGFSSIWGTDRDGQRQSLEYRRQLVENRWVLTWVIENSRCSVKEMMEHLGAEKHDLPGVWHSFSAPIPSSQWSLSSINSQLLLSPRHLFGDSHQEDIRCQALVIPHSQHQIWYWEIGHKPQSSLSNIFKNLKHVCRY